MFGLISNYVKNYFTNFFDTSVKSKNSHTVRFDKLPHSNRPIRNRQKPSRLSYDKNFNQKVI